MRIRLVLNSLVLLVLGGSIAAGEEIKGNVYYLGIALDQQGAAGGWAQVGANGDWKDTAAGTILHDQLYSAEHAGGLFVTDLTNGNWRQIGGNDFGTTRFMVTSGDQLFTIEESGNLYRIDPNGGAWQQIGAAGDWKDTLVAAVLNDQLYTIETSGNFFRTDLNTGQWLKIGNADFAQTQFLFANGNSLYTIETTGTLFRVNPGDGSWAAIGRAGQWKNTVGGAILGGRLYTAQSDGKLFCTDLRSGNRREVGKADFAATRFMFPVGGKLYTIEESGNLYRVEARAGELIEAFNCFPDEWERVLREQGKGLSHELVVKKIEGDHATYSAILAGLDWLKAARSEDLAVVYLTAHGGTDPNTGWSIGTADLKTLAAREIKQRLGRVDANVLFLLETCECGGFAAAHRDDPPVPANVTVLCACRANESTDNPLDIAVDEALCGRADFNHDGVVDVDELIRYVGLRYKELWPAGGQGSNTPVIVRSRRLSGSLALTHATRELAAVAINNDFWSAIELGHKGDDYDLRLLGWPGLPGKAYFIANSAPRIHLCLPGDGEPLMVNQQGHWRPARLVGREGNQLTIQYLNDPCVQEKVSSDRIRYAFVGQKP